MSRKTFLVHKHCGARLSGNTAYCPRCNKWLVGDSIDRVKKKLPHQGSNLDLTR